MGRPPNQANPPDIEAQLIAIEKDLEGKPDAKRLRAIRDLLDDAAFVPQLKALLARRHNDPKIYEVPNRVIRIMRLAEEGRDRMETHRGLVSAIGAGGSVGMVVAGLISSLNPTIGLVALAVAAGGPTMAGIGWFGLCYLDERRTLYRQVAERLVAVSKAIE